MPINVFGNNSSSHDKGKKIDTSLFVQKPYLRTNLIDCNIEEDVNMNHYRIKNLRDPVGKAVSKLYVDNKYNDPSLLKNTAHVDFNYKTLDNLTFVEVNSLPAINQHLTPKQNVDDAIDEISLVRNNQNIYFENYNLSNIKGTTLITQAVNVNQVITKPCVGQFHQKIEQPRRDSGINFRIESNDIVNNNQDNKFDDNKLTNLDSTIVNRHPTSDNELAKKKYIGK